jgi:deoxyadenosine/deoxycytidine kinase
MARPISTDGMFFKIRSLSNRSSTSSTYSEPFSLENLIHQVDASARVAQLNTIERLLKENEMCEREAALYRMMWDNLMELLGEVLELAVLIRGSVEDYDDRTAAAEEKWLASWGISKHSTWI